MENIFAYSDSDSDDVENEGNTIALCQICKIVAMNYKCPRCFMLTCSLECCKKHKAQFDCNGIRNKCQYVSVQDFSESNLRNDYHFLEDVLQTKRRAKILHGQAPSSRHNSKLQRIRQSKPGDSRSHTYNNNKSSIVDHKNSFQTYETPSCKKLVKACQKRNTNIIIFSSGMTKRKLNTSYYQIKPDIIFWRLHIVFITYSHFNISELFKVDPLEDKTEHFTKKGYLVEYCLPAVKEHCCIETILKDIFEVKVENAILRHTLRGLRPSVSDISNVEYSNSQHSSNIATQCGSQPSFLLGSLCCLMQKIPSVASSPTFFEVPLQFTLQMALQGRAVVEYPTLFIGLQQDMTKLSRTVETVAEGDAASGNAIPIIRRCEGQDLENVKQKKLRKSLEAEESEAVQFKEFEIDEIVDNDDYNSENRSDPDNDDCAIEDDDENGPSLNLSGAEFLEMLHQVENADLQTLKQIVESEDLIETKI